MATNLFYVIPFICLTLAALIFAQTLSSVKDFAVFLAILCFLGLVLYFTVYDSHTSQFQFITGDYREVDYPLYLGTDGLSLYFIILTTFILPVAMLSNYVSVKEYITLYATLLLGIEVFLLLVFLVLDAILFYIFFESILPPLFLVIGLYGSKNKIKAGFYLFLYTLLGSLFLLLAIVGLGSIINTTDYDTLYKCHLLLITQQFLFGAAFIAMGVKTPVIFLNVWLLKAHVESPLSASIILAAIVLKLSLFIAFRIVLPMLIKAFMQFASIVFSIGVASVLYASASTMRTIDVKELIAYSSVCHAAVYLLSVFSNCLQGIEGAITLGLGHGLVSPGLFICAGGVLYDRVHTRIMPFFRGLSHTMPLFAILFFILCLANCGAPLTLNFIGEFLSLYGIFERSWLFGALASSSIIFSAAYTMFMYQRISLGGTISRMFIVNIPDLNKREFVLLLTLVIPTVLLGMYPAAILDGIQYSVSTLLYCFDNQVISCDAPNGWGLYFNDSTCYSTLFAAVFLCILIILGFRYYNLIKNYLNKLLYNINYIVIYLSENKNQSYSYYLLATVIAQILYFIYCCGDISLLCKFFMVNYAEWADFSGYNNIAYAGAGEDSSVESPKDYDGTVYRSNPEGERGTGGTTNGATTNGATTNGATTNGATTNGQSSNSGGGNNSGGNGSSDLSICPDRDGEGHVWTGDNAQISSEFRCHYNESHPAGRTVSYYFCAHCGAYSCANCL